MSAGRLPDRPSGRLCDLPVPQLITGAAPSGAAAYKKAGLTPADIDVREIYDCYTYTVLVTLEDYGFCGKGEGGELAARGGWHPATPAAASCRRSTCGNDAVAGSRHSGPGPGRPAAGP